MACGEMLMLSKSKESNVVVDHFGTKPKSVPPPVSEDEAWAFINCFDGFKGFERDEVVFLNASSSQLDIDAAMATVQGKAVVACGRQAEIKQLSLLIKRAQSAGAICTCHVVPVHRSIASEQLDLFSRSVAPLE